MSEWCEQTSEWTSEWPSTPICILGYSGPLCPIKIGGNSVGLRFAVFSSCRNYDQNFVMRGDSLDKP